MAPFLCGHNKNPFECPLGTKYTNAKSATTIAGVVCHDFIDHGLDPAPADWKPRLYCDVPYARHFVAAGRSIGKSTNTAVSMGCSVGMASGTTLLSALQFFEFSWVSEGGYPINLPDPRNMRPKTWSASTVYHDGQLMTRERWLAKKLNVPLAVIHLRDIRYKQPRYDPAKERHYARRHNGSPRRPCYR